MLLGNVGAVIITCCRVNCRLFNWWWQTYHSCFYLFWFFFFFMILWSPMKGGEVDDFSLIKAPIWCRKSLCYLCCCFNCSAFLGITLSLWQKIRIPMRNNYIYIYIYIFIMFIFIVVTLISLAHYCRSVNGITSFWSIFADRSPLIPWFFISHPWAFVI